jgi:hypothetical protein
MECLKSPPPDRLLPLLPPLLLLLLLLRREAAALCLAAVVSLAKCAKHRPSWRRAFLTVVLPYLFLVSSASQLIPSPNSHVALHANSCASFFGGANGHGSVSTSGHLLPVDPLLVRMAVLEMYRELRRWICPPPHPSMQRAAPWSLAEGILRAFARSLRRFQRKRESASKKGRRAPVSLTAIVLLALLSPFTVLVSSLRAFARTFQSEDMTGRRTTVSRFTVSPIQVLLVLITLFTAPVLAAGESSGRQQGAGMLTSLLFALFIVLMVFPGEWWNSICPAVWIWQ